MNELNNESYLTRVQKLKLWLSHNEELSGAVIVATGSVVGSFFSYLLQFFLARLLSVENFGTFTALLSLAYLVGVPSAVIGTSLVKTVSNLLAKKDFDSLTVLFRKLLAYTFCLSVLVFFLFWSLSDIISSYLNITTPSIVVFFGIFMGISFLSVIPQSFLQGLLRFKALAVYVSLSSFIRLIVPLILVLLSFELYGVFIGLSISVIFSVFIGKSLLKKNITNNASVDITKLLRSMLVFSIPVMFTNFGLILLNNMDMILVKKYFDSTQAGYYAGVVTLGKILLFGAGTVSLIMFPKIASLYAQGRPLKKDFMNFVVIQLAFIIFGVTIFSTLPGLITNLFFGSRFSGSISYLPSFSIFMGIYVLVNFLVLFFLSINKTKVCLLFVPCVIGQFYLLTHYHSSLSDVIKVNIGTILTLLVFLLIYLYHQKTQIFNSAEVLV